MPRSSWKTFPSIPPFLYCPGYQINCWAFLKAYYSQEIIQTIWLNIIIEWKVIIFLSLLLCGRARGKREIEPSFRWLFSLEENWSNTGRLFGVPRIVPAPLPIPRSCLRKDIVYYWKLRVGTMEHNCATQYEKQALIIPEVSTLITFNRHFI